MKIELWILGALAILVLSASFVAPAPEMSWDAVYRRCLENPYSRLYLLDRTAGALERFCRAQAKRAAPLRP